MSHVKNSLERTVHALLAHGKGILAADESIGTCNMRFASHGIPQTDEMRRQWRQLLFTTSEIDSGLSGVILIDETIRQKTDTGIPFAEYLASRGIIPGIKVDQGTSRMIGSEYEELTNGLHGLPGRLAEYVAMGARFAKWRAVILIGDNIPTDDCIRENARRLAMNAMDCERADIVPILEPEVLIDGTHGIVHSAQVLAKTLSTTLVELKIADVNLRTVILKSSMALPGIASTATPDPSQVAEHTLDALRISISSEVSGIAFLSGGQRPKDATIRLNEIVKRVRGEKSPWRITFSYSRALQEDALGTWLGKSDKVGEAQDVFKLRVKETALASEGRFA